jgi:CubicO group peptidase (beta-lactamase class C family)
MSTGHRWFGLILVVALAAGCASTPEATQPPPTASVATATAAPPATPTVPAATATSEDLATQIEALVATYVENNKVSGAMLVARGDEILLRQAYGLADRDANLANTLDTRFRIGSVSKAITAVAVFLLQDQGRLDIHDPICDYVPDCPAAWQPVTIHHLLTHTSGIPDAFGTSDPKAPWPVPCQVESALALFRDMPLRYEPGARWQYNGAGFIVLAQIIEAASGQRYEDFLQAAMFDPLGMVNSGFDHDQSSLAIGYRSGAGGRAAFQDMCIVHAAGGLSSSVEDLYRLDQALYSDEFLSPALRDLMFSDVIDNVEPDLGGSMGYGWFVGELLNHRVANHAGLAQGYSAYLARFPEDRVTVIMLSNQEAPEIGYFAPRIFKLVFAAP